MLIGIDASRAFIKQRTGIEEYSYQVIKHLMDKFKGHQVILYVRKSQKIDFNIPQTWKSKVINFPFLWTQIGLSLEMLFHPVDVLFIPAHIIPIIHAKNTIVTIHGLEFEFCPKAYPFWARLYMRWAIKHSCRAAKKIIAVSENTKKDLINLYKVPEDKIEVIFEGVSENSKFQITNSKSISKCKIENSKFLLYVGRLEERKNILGILEAFKIFKEKYNTSQKLVLAGKFGFGENKIKKYLSHSSYQSDIILPGFVDEKEKWELLKNADVFLFPTFYEGFGLPILEAQSAGVPVVASNNSSVPEVIENSALLVNPQNPSEIAEAVYELVIDEQLRDDIIKKGYENTKRFSWKKCAENIAKILII